MSPKKAADHTRQNLPVQVASLGELRAYTVHEYELDLIAAGSPATLAFNFAVALVSIGVSFMLILTTTRIDSDRLFYGYLNACIICLLAGIIMLAYWLKTRTSVDSIVAEIKSRLIDVTPIQQAPPSDPAGS